MKSYTYFSLFYFCVRRTLLFILVLNKNNIPFKSERNKKSEKAFWQDHQIPSTKPNLLMVAN